MADEDVPILMDFLYGDKAKLAMEALDQRLLRWCQAFEDWLAERQKVVHHLTYKNSRFAWKQMLAQVGKPPWKISKSDVSGYVEWLQEQGRAPGTIRLHLGAISSFYSWCDERGVDPDCDPGFDPVKGIARPKVRRYAKAQVLSREEACALLAALKLDDYAVTKRDYAFFLARLRMGVTVKDLLEMRWGEVGDGERRFAYGRGGGSETAPLRGGMEAKEGSETAPLQGGSGTEAIPEDVRRAIVDYLWAAGRLEGIGPEAYIFAPLADPLNRDACGEAEDWDGSRHVNSQRMRETLKTFGRLAGIPDEKLTLQALRHTAVMLRLEAGDSAEEIQAFLNRASLRSTERYLSLLPVRSLVNVAASDPPADSPRPPDRRTKQYQPGDNFRHGYYAKSRPPEEIEAMLAQDIQGLGEEMAGMRMLHRGLVEMQGRAASAAELAALINAQSLLATRLAQLIKVEEERQAQRPEESWAEQFIARLANSAEERGEGFDIDKEKEMLLAGDAEAQAAVWRLREEIAATRLGLRRAFHLAVETDDIQERVHLADIYGRGCNRLVKLLKAEGYEHTRLEAAMNKLVDRVILNIQEDWGLR